MKQIHGVALAILAALCVTVLPAPAAAQRMQVTDTANMTVASQLRAVSAATGSSVNIADYASVAMLIATSHTKDTAAVIYAVMQDSGGLGPATWTAEDSVAIDSTSNKIRFDYYTGIAQYVREVIRASAGTDTAAIGVDVILGDRRAFGGKIQYP